MNHLLYSGVPLKWRLIVPLNKINRRPGPDEGKGPRGYLAEHVQQEYVGVSRGAHSDVLAMTGCSLLSPHTLDAPPPPWHCYYSSLPTGRPQPHSPPNWCRRMGNKPETDKMEARVASMVQGAINQCLGPLVNQLAPLVTQLRTSQRSTGSKSTRSVLCMPLPPPTPGIREPTQAFMQGAYVLGP